MTTKAGFALLLCTAMIAIGLVASFVDPIPQDPRYHQFADARTLLGIGNFSNVLSNLPFLAVAGWGLWRLSRLQARQHALP